MAKADNKVQRQERENKFSSLVTLSKVYALWEHETKCAVIENTEQLLAFKKSQN